MNEDNEIIDFIATIIAFLIVIFISITGIVWLITLCIDFWKGFF